MIDFIRNVKNKDELLLKASHRLRPIMLTSITTLIGLMTLIFFPTGQAVILQPLAISLGYGLFWGTVLNLLYLPTLFAIVKRIKND
jgi:multidrug efflux pump subunit AcrB